MENLRNAVKSASIETVIIVKILKGTGTEKDPARTAIQYWDLDGKFLFERDHCAD